MLQAIHQYKIILKTLPQIIDVSGYKNEYLSKKLGITPANFSAKKQRNSWTVDEVEELLKIAMNEDVEDFLLQLELEMAEAQGYETISYKALKKEMGWK
ncbi:MAG: hypothetical protein QM640_05355 [Niabella sp.]